MPRLSRSQLIARDRIQIAARSALHPHEFARRVIEAIGLVAPFDDARFFGLDSGSRLINRLLYATATDAPHRRGWLQSIYLAESGSVPYFAPQVLLDHAVSVVTYRPVQTDCFGLDDAIRSRVDPRTHWRVFHETETPRGGSLRIMLSDRNQPVGMIDCMRRGADRPFTAIECGFLRSLTRTIAQGLSSALTCEQAMQAQVSCEPLAAPGIVILDGAGNSMYQSRQGTMWLEQLAQSDHSRHDPLPSAARAAMARFREVALAGPTQVRVNTPLGPATIEASAGQEPDQIVLVISPQTERTRAQIPESWALTRSEREVVRLVIGGQRNRAIATRLVIAESTVETHLAHIYEKLGVRSRGELLARLFGETGLLVSDS